MQQQIRLQQRNEQQPQHKLIYGVAFSGTGI